MDDNNALNIYTDGSAPKNPGTGGIGVRFIFPDYLGYPNPIKDFDLPGYEGGGIGTMEIIAVVSAFKEVLRLGDIKKIKRVVVYSDSMYVVDNYKNAIFYWPKNKWRKNDGSPVLNTEPWKELVKLAQKISREGISIDIKKVRGHSSDPHNKAVDKLAKKSAKLPLRNISPSNIVRRKNTNKKTVRGSIHGLGQIIKIRVIDSQYLKMHKEFRYRCEVVSKKNKFYGGVDFFHSKEILRAGHTYIVKLVENKTYLQIIRIIKEIR